MRILPEKQLKQLIDRLHTSISAHERPDMTNAPCLGAFVLDQLRGAPLLIYIGMLTLSLVFFASPVLRWGRFFTQLEAASQEQHILSWRNSRIGLKRDYIYFFQSFIVVGMYDGSTVSTDGNREIV